MPCVPPDVYPKSQSPMSEATVYNVTRDSVLGDAIEIAGSSKTRNKGLLGRHGIEPGGGLWIVPCEAIHMFFMKFAIDAVFLDRKKRVTKAVTALKPWRPKKETEAAPASNENSITRQELANQPTTC